MPAWWRRTRTETADGRGRTRAKALGWRQCAVCSYDIRTGDGERDCHWGACPTLPDELDVFCPTCNYAFFTREGSPECGEFPRCEFARAVAPSRVRSVREWSALHAEHPGGRR